MKYFNILILILTFLTACKSKSQNENINATNSGNKSLAGSKSGSTIFTGVFSFKANGELITAESDKVKSWTTTQFPIGIIIASNKNGLFVSMQIKNMTGAGSYKLDGDDKGTVHFTVNGHTYFTKGEKGENVLNLNVTNTKGDSTMILLSGTFDGVLEDKDGNKLQITEGVFSTDKM